MTTMSNDELAIEHLPLAPMQAAFVEYDKREPGTYLGDQFVVATGTLVRGPLDLGLLRDSLVELTKRHDVLKIQFNHDNESGELTQFLIPDREPQWAVQEEEDAPTEIESWGEACLRDFISSGFPAAAGGVVTGLTVYIAAKEYFVVCLGGHHLALDAESVHALMAELWDVYEALSNEEPLPEPTNATWASYCLTTAAKSFDPSRVDAAREYWQQVFDGAHEAALPRDRSLDTNGESRNLVMSEKKLAPIFMERLSAASNDWRCVRNAIPFAALMKALSTRLGSSDLYTFTTQNARVMPAYRGLIGLLLLTFPIRLDASKSLGEMSASFQTQALQANRHNVLNAKTIREIAVEGSISYDRLTHAPIAVQYIPEVELQHSIKKLEITRIGGPEAQDSSWVGSWVEIIFKPGPERSRILCRHNPSTFDATTIASLLDDTAMYLDAELPRTTR